MTAAQMREGEAIDTLSHPETAATQTYSPAAPGAYG
jgi:hypothetical protein